MSTIITTIQEGDLISGSRTDINNNFDSVLNNKIETSVIDTDTALTANSDAKVPTQKAVKAYVDSGGQQNASETVRGLVEEATDAEVAAGTATGATGAKLFVTPAKLSTYLESSFTAPTTQTFQSIKTSYGGGDTQFDITNPVGTTFRYTWDGTGTNPTINTTNFPVGAIVQFNSEQSTNNNNGNFTIISSGTNYFEVTNASGVAESNKILDSLGQLTVTYLQTWTKPAGLKYAIVEIQAGGGGSSQGTGGAGHGASNGGAGGGYSRKFIVTGSLGSTETILVGSGGMLGRRNSGGQVSASSGIQSYFGSHISATGGGISGVVGGIGTGGDLNLEGRQGGVPLVSSDEYAGGSPGASYLMQYGEGALGGFGNGFFNGNEGKNGIVIVNEFYG